MHREESIIHLHLRRVPRVLLVRANGGLIQYVRQRVDGVGNEAQQVQRYKVRRQPARRLALVVQLHLRPVARAPCHKVYPPEQNVEKL